MKIIAIIHARMSSSRLPGKVMKDLMGRSVFYHHWERLKQCKKIKTIYLATSKNKNNKPLIAEAVKYGIPYYAGAEEDVVERYIAIAKLENAKTIVRCGCDKPLVSYEILNSMLEQYCGEDLLYITTPLAIGIGSEIISCKALECIHSRYRGPAISKYMFEYPYLFKMKGIEVENEFSRPEFRLTLDTKEDYTLIRKIYKHFYKDSSPVDLREVFKYLDDHPELANINRFVENKKINVYVRELEGKPVFSVYRAESGNYIAKNRMGEFMPYREFKKIMDKASWEV